MPTSAATRPPPPPAWLTGLVMPAIQTVIALLLGWVLWTLQINTTSQKEVLARIEGMDRRLTVLEQIATTQTQTLSRVVETQNQRGERLRAVESVLELQRGRKGEW